MLHRHARWQIANVGVFFGFIGDHHDALRTFGPHALCNLHHAVTFRALADLLAAGHGHGVVVQNFVGDVDACRNGLAHRQQTAVEIGAVAQVGEHVLVMHKGLLAHPGDSLAPHLGKAHGGAVHPDGHEMAANAGHGARPFWHQGAGVVRAARTKPGLAIGRRCAELQGRHGALFGVQDGDMRVHAR